MAKRNSKTTGNKRQREQDKLRKRRVKEERKVARKQAARASPTEGAPIVDQEEEPDEKAD